MIDSTGASDPQDALMRAGRVAEALALLENAMPTWRRLVGNNPDYADMLLYLSRSHLANGRVADVAARILVHSTTPYGRQWDEQAALLQQQVNAALMKSG